MQLVSQSSVRFSYPSRCSSTFFGKKRCISTTLFPIPCENGSEAPLLHHVQAACCTAPIQSFLPKILKKKTFPANGPGSINAAIPHRTRRLGQPCIKIAGWHLHILSHTALLLPHQSSERVLLTLTVRVAIALTPPASICCIYTYRRISIDTRELATSQRTPRSES